MGVTFKYKDEVSPALAMLRKGATSKAKLRAAVRPAARVMKMKLQGSPVPFNKSPKKSRSLRGAIFMSGNLRKSSLIVANLRKTSFLLVGHRWGEINAGAVVGSTNRGARGFYGHMVHGGTNNRKTKKGANRGRISAIRYMDVATTSVQSQIQGLVERGFLALLQKEKQRAGLT